MSVSARRPSSANAVSRLESPNRLLAPRQRQPLAAAEVAVERSAQAAFATALAAAEAKPVAQEEDPALLRLEPRQLWFNLLALDQPPAFALDSEPWVQALLGDEL